jgi:hypothetical protein
MLLDVPLHIKWELLLLQQDGTPPYFGKWVTAFLNQYFQNHCIGQKGPDAWTPRSPDLTPLYSVFGDIRSPWCMQ